MKLRHYFRSHTIIILTSYALKNVLSIPKVFGRLVHISIELGEYDINFQLRIAIKAQVVVDFVAEHTKHE